MNGKRLFIVANRLPVTVDPEKGTKPSSGGLVSAMNSFLDHACAEGKEDFSEIFWTGIPGCSATEWTSGFKQESCYTYTFLPVFASRNLYSRYYNGFANSVLWPLFHYFPSYAEYRQEDFDAYIHINKTFFETLSRSVHPNDVVWIHDYHLLPLAGMLRKAFPELTIGFFLHIPFPSFEIVRIMPRQWQEELIRGMLGADLIGFHTIDYASHFLQSVQMVLGLDHEMHVFRHDDRLIKIDVFPISIDFDLFHDAYYKEAVVHIRESMRENMKGKKIIFSVDRLDYTKGLHNRLKAYEHFLLNNPEYQNQVVFVVVVVPSRDEIAKYAERKRMTDELISSINSQIGNFHWQPVIYQYNTLTFEQMLGLYTASDMAMITPLRDGMNLVAKEFVASRRDRQGVLLISEMAGAARELTDALTINPNDIHEMSNRIREGLEMPAEEQRLRMDTMQGRIRAYDVQTWAEDFLSQLEQIKKRQEEYRVKFLDEYHKKELLHTYCHANRRLILLDYDGTLVPFSAHPSEAKPTRSLLRLIQDLGSVPYNDVYIISGRNSDWLETWFGKLPVNLVAEHGARIKIKGGTWLDQLSEAKDWKSPVQKIMEVYVRRCPNTFIEMKEFSMVWHYRNANQEHAKLRAMELLTEMNEYSHSLGLQVLLGNKNLEVRKHGIHKGMAIREILAQYNYDFILAAGDDNTDEDMFRVLSGRTNCYTIKVGAAASFAEYNLSTPQMVYALLDTMMNYSRLAVM